MLTAIRPERQPEAEELLDRTGVWWERIGDVSDAATLEIHVSGERLVNVPVAQLTEAWTSPIAAALDHGGGTA